MANPRRRQSAQFSLPPLPNTETAHKRRQSSLVAVLPPLQPGEKEETSTAVPLSKTTVSSSKIHPLVETAAASFPLRDLTNGDDEEEEVVAIVSKTESNMLPSSAVEQQPQPAKVASPSKRKTLSDSVKDDDEDDNTNHNDQVCHKKHKRHDDAMDTVSQQQKEQEQQHSELIAVQPPEPTTELVGSLAEIRHLVHLYTDKNNTTATLIDTLHNRTGYVVTPPVIRLDNDEDCSSDMINNMNHRKAELWQTMGPDLRAMDQAKQETARLVQAVTGCHVVKSRGGRVRYARNDMAHMIIRPAAYEARYMCMLDEVQQIQSQRWQDYFEALQQKQREHGVRVVDEVKGNDTEQMMIQQEQPQDKAAQLCKRLFASPAVLPEMKDDVTSFMKDLPQEEHEHSQSVVLPEHAMNNNKTEQQQLDCSPTTRADDDHDTQDKDESPSPGGLVLPLPDRDTVCDDPEIAQAEAALWKSMDQALKVYSAQVLAIQARRQF